jgi:DNA-binding MarR family transcriptional regulator
MSSDDHRKLVEELSLLMRASTTHTVMLHHTIAAKSGINVTDLQCLNVLGLEGAMTPGQLAEAMALTTGGAITAVIDRLEKAGFVHRRRDEQDRRRVIVEVVGAAEMATLAARFAPVAQIYEALMSEYSAEDLAVLIDYLKRNNAVFHEVIEKVRALD